MVFVIFCLINAAGTFFITLINLRFIQLALAGNLSNEHKLQVQELSWWWVKAKLSRLTSLLTPGLIPSPVNLLGIVYRVMFTNIMC